MSRHLPSSRSGSIAADALKICRFFVPCGRPSSRSSIEFGQLRTAIKFDVLADRLGDLFAAADGFEFLFALDFLLDGRGDGEQADGKDRHDRHHGEQRHSAFGPFLLAVAVIIV